MSSSISTKRLSEMRLALLADCGCDDTLASLEAEARSAGLTGAEIDSALSGSSFEAKSTIALEVACAVKSGEAAVLDAAERHAIDAGFDPIEITYLVRLATSILTKGHPQV